MRESRGKGRSVGRGRVIYSDILGSAHHLKLLGDFEGFLLRMVVICCRTQKNGYDMLHIGPFLDLQKDCIISVEEV